MEGSLLTSPTRRSGKDQEQTLVRERGNHHLPLGQRQRCLGAGPGREVREELQRRVTPPRDFLKRTRS